MKRILYISSVLLLCAVACTKILETEPRQSISADIALTSKTGVNSLLNSTYSIYRGATIYGRDRIILPDLLADNLFNTTSNNNSWRNQEANQLNTGVGDWADDYSIILRSNLIIDAVDKNTITDATADDKTLFKGEALFFRALAYFELGNAYGYLPGKEVNNWKLSVPLILTPTRSLEDVTFPERATNDTVYAQVTKDLLASIGLLKNSSNGRSGKAYVSKAAAQALLSRVYLYLDKWSDVIAPSTEVLTTTTINTKAVTLAITGAGLVNMWREAKDKSEGIWELSYLTGDNLGTASVRSWLSIYPKPLYATCDAPAGQPANPARSSFADLRISTVLLGLYNSTDIRRAQLVEGPYCKLGQTGLYFSNKFSGTGGDPYLDNIMAFRISEVLLNRAEAYARTGNLPLAKADLDVIRTRAGLTAYTLGSQGDLIAEILLQRRLELAFEGHRWFDLIRLKQDIPKVPGGLASFSVLEYTDRRILTPIPSAQIDVNAKLKQNPGY